MNNNRIAIVAFLHTHVIALFSCVYRLIRVLINIYPFSGNSCKLLQMQQPIQDVLSEFHPRGAWFQAERDNGWLQCEQYEDAVMAKAIFCARNYFQCNCIR